MYQVTNASQNWLRWERGWESYVQYQYFPTNATTYCLNSYWHKLQLYILIHDGVKYASYVSCSPYFSTSILCDFWKSNTSLIACGCIFVKNLLISCADKFGVLLDELLVIKFFLIGYVSCLTFKITFVPISIFFILSNYKDRHLVVAF